jgi:hypothetical protein
LPPPICRYSMSSSRESTASKCWPPSPTPRRSSTVRIQSGVCPI